MNPTPVSPISNSVQLKPKSQQKVRPEEFEAQFAGYLAKEKPHTLHKESTNETVEEEKTEDSQEEPTEEKLTSDSPVLYFGPFNINQEQQPIKSTLIKSEQLQVEVNQLLNSSEPVFAAQVAVESEKIEAFDKKEDGMLDTQKAQIIKNVDNLLVKKSDLIEVNQILVTAKEIKLGATILPTGRFLTAEWKNGQLGVTQLIVEPTNLAEVSMNEGSGETVQPIELNGTTSDNQQLNLATMESKLNSSVEPSVKDPNSLMKDLESAEQVAEVDKSSQPIQQQSLVEALTLKSSSVGETVKQASIQMVSEVIIQEAESLLSGKQSVAQVTLSPEKLGEVRITVELIDNVLTTKIIVDNVETRELLTTGMSRLTDNLDRQNIRLEELTIQLNDHATADSASQERQGEGQKRTFGQKQARILGNESEPLNSEGKTDTGRLSILV